MSVDKFASWSDEALTGSADEEDDEGERRNAAAFESPCPAEDDDEDNEEEEDAEEDAEESAWPCGWVCTALYPFDCRTQHEERALGILNLPKGRLRILKRRPVNNPNNTGNMEEGKLERNNWIPRVYTNVLSLNVMPRTLYFHILGTSKW
jgi:hypothetical protein